MDIPSTHDGSQAVVLHYPDHRDPFGVFTTAGMLILMGTNERFGLCVNNLSMLPSSPSGVPVAFVARMLLEQETIEKAAETCKQLPHATGQHYALASFSKLISLESCAAGVFQVESDDRVLHTNHPLAEAAQAVSAEVTDDFGKTRERLAAIEACSSGFTSETDVMNALKDTSAPVSRESKGGWMTFGSLVCKFDAKGGVDVWIAPGPPHLVDFQKIPFPDVEGWVVLISSF